MFQIMGAAIKNRRSAKFISAKCFKRPIREVLENLPLYGTKNTSYDVYIIVGVIFRFRQISDGIGVFSEFKIQLVGSLGWSCSNSPLLSGPSDSEQNELDAIDECTRGTGAMLA